MLMAAKLICLICFFVFCTFPARAEEHDATKNITVAKYDDATQSLPKKHDLLTEIQVKENFVYYDIDGVTPADLLSQMKHNGTKWSDGKIYAALTTWNIRYDYDITLLNGRYYLGSIKTKVDIVFHLPRLVPSAKTPDQLATTWKTYIGNLTNHEVGHRDLAVSAGQEIYQILASIGSSTNKSELDQEAKRLVEAKLQRLKKAQVEYDAETHHGKTQGAVLM
jgi:predicted secreted Zn-dependent protease